MSMFKKICKAVRAILRIDERVLVIYDAGYVAAITKDAGGVDVSRLERAVRFYVGVSPYRSAWFGTRSPLSNDGHFIARLKECGIEPICNYVLVSRRSTCAHCGGAEEKWVQKGVDVGISVFVMKELSRFDRLVMVAGDGDFIELTDEVARQGKMVSVLGTEGTISEALKKTVSRTINISDIIRICRPGPLAPEDEQSWRQIGKAIPDQQGVVAGF